MLALRGLSLRRNERLLSRAVKAPYAELLALGRMCAGALRQSENAYDDERQPQPNGCRVQGKAGIAQSLIAAHCDVNARNDARQTA
jgi:hypothetical protein